MELVDLLTRFADGETIHTLTVSQKLYASLITTALGMGITFVSLIVLQIITTLFERLAPTRTADHGRTPTETTAKIIPQKNLADGQEELAAAVTTALALMLETSTSTIVIRTIRRLEDHTPPWSRAGINEQVQNTV